MRKLASLVIVVVVGLASAASANILLNPSFENADIAGSWSPTNWWRSDGNDRTDINSWGGGWAAQDGSWAMKLNNNGGNPGDHYLGTEVSTNVEVGASVTISFYTFVNNAPYFSNAYLDVGMMTAGDDTWFNNLDFSGGLSNQTFGSGWVQYSFTITNLTPNVNAVQAWLNFKGVDSPGGTDLLIDSASLTIPEPTMAALLGFSGLIFLAGRRIVRRK